MADRSDQHDSKGTERPEPVAYATDEADSVPMPDHARRDGDGLVVMGVFIALLAMADLVGMFWTTASEDRIVTLAAGFILLAIGIGAVWLGRRLRRRGLRPSEDGVQ